MTLDREQRNWLCLTLVPGVGTTRFVRLLARFRTPGSVLGAAEADLADVVGQKLAQRIRSHRETADLERQIEALAHYDVQLVTMDDPDYPPRLAEIYDPPLALFVRGALHECDFHSIALVGTRKASAYGLRMAGRLAGDLAARGITIVSGLAAGVDAAAHQGALDAGGRTLAVLGSGVDVVFPSENAALMQATIEKGAVISPFPMGMKALRGNFPQRNRIISGLCMGTLVIEAPPGSGALITARTAAEQGREVFALPGQVGNRNSMGPHALIREGAKLVETAEDILVELEAPTAMRQKPVTETLPAQAHPALQPVASSPTPPAPPPRQEVVTEVEKDVLSSLGPDGSFVDEIAMACRISVSEALSSLTLLELKGMVRQFSGKRFAPR